MLDIYEKAKELEEVLDLLILTFTLSNGENEYCLEHEDEGWCVSYYLKKNKIDMLGFKVKVTELYYYLRFDLCKEGYTVSKYDTFDGCKVLYLTEDFQNFINFIRLYLTLVG